MDIQKNKYFQKRSDHSWNEKHLYPYEGFEEKIAFNKIRQILLKNCLSSLGKEMVYAVSFSTDFEWIQRNISEGDEMVKMLTTETEEFPVEDMHDVRDALDRVRIEGLFLDEQELFAIRRSLQATARIVSYIKALDEKLYPTLFQLIQDIGSYIDILKRIDRILDKFGKIKDNATPELAQIRREMQQAHGNVSRVLHSILKQAQSEGIVDKDLSPTLRDGRLVIPVSPAYKRKIKGIIHDESATGKTVFIEPQQVVDANNRIRELENEERREIMRILVEITDSLRPHFKEIHLSQLFLGKIDFLRSKSLFAIQLNCVKPQFEAKQQFNWIQARHPLLEMTLKTQGKSIVPLDIELNENQRIILISGPNAGGKSVCLKTVVLLQYMFQCGLLVPVEQQSKAGIFDRIFIDIGDEQSIENDLSTYSSHLMNIKHFIRYGNDKTLLLIDEFGTGTEPQIGGAIAEAALDTFNQNHIFGIITTHYTNLKHFAEDTTGIVNGAMLYDRHHLQPLFQLQIGQPGSSFAIDIARKIGLPDDLINRAAKKVGQDHLDYDKYLQDIVRDKRYWSKKREDVRRKEKRLEETLQKYENELADSGKQRKQILRQAQSDAEKLLKAANAKIENTIRKIKEAEAEKGLTKAARVELEKFKEDTLRFSEKEFGKNSGKRKKGINKQQPIKKIATGNKKSKTEQEFFVGQSVKLLNQSVVGTVVELDEKEAVVAFGQLKSTVKLNQLVSVNASKPRQAARQSQPQHHTVTDNIRERKNNFRSEIDIRGMRWEEALQAVTFFIDDAQIVGISGVRILHGTGTGALRQLVRDYLQTVYGVKKFHDEHVQFGGAGITVVEFE